MSSSRCVALALPSSSAAISSMASGETTSSAKFIVAIVSASPAGRMRHELLLVADDDACDRHPPGLGHRVEQQAVGLPPPVAGAR